MPAGIRALLADRGGHFGLFGLLFFAFEVVLTAAALGHFTVLLSHVGESFLFAGWKFWGLVGLMNMPETEQNVYTIGVIADTHNKWKPRIGECFAGVDEIWHLGDICKESVLDNLRGLCPVLHVVLGNNDFGLDYPLTRTLERNGEVFRLMHIPPHTMPDDADWLLHGHTHVPRDETVHGVHVFNPGSACMPNKGAPTSLGFLRSVDGGPFETEVRLIN